MSQQQYDALLPAEKTIYSDIFHGYMKQRIGSKVPDWPMSQGWIQDAKRIARLHQSSWGQQIAQAIQNPSGSSGLPSGSWQYYSPPAPVSGYAVSYYAGNYTGGGGGNGPQFPPGPPSIYSGYTSEARGRGMQVPRGIAPPPSDAGGSGHSRRPPASVHSAGGGGGSKVGSISEWAESISNAPPPSIAGPPSVAGSVRSARTGRSEARSRRSGARAPSLAGTVPEESVRSGTQRGEGGTVRAPSEAGSQRSRATTNRTSADPSGRRGTVKTVVTERTKTRSVEKRYE